jgi:hypothetical protein
MGDLIGPIGDCGDFAGNSKEWACGIDVGIGGGAGHEDEHGLRSPVWIRDLQRQDSAGVGLSTAD